MYKRTLIDNFFFKIIILHNEWIFWNLILNEKERKKTPAALFKI